MDVCCIQNFYKSELFIQHEAINDIKIKLKSTEKYYCKNKIAIHICGEHEGNLKYVLNKLIKHYNKKVNKFIKIMTNENSSKLIKYLLNIANTDINCLKCDARCKIFTNYCCYCFNYKEHYDEIKSKIFELFLIEEDKSRFEMEFMIFYQYCFMLRNEIFKFYDTYRKKKCITNIVFSFCKEDVFKVHEFIKILLYDVSDGDILSTNQKAQMLLDKKCYELFKLPRKYIKSDYVDMSSEISKYLDGYCKFKHIENILNLSRNLRSYIVHINNNGRQDLFKFIHCKNISLPKEFWFCFELMENNKYFRYVKQLFLHPVLCCNLVSDCFVLLDIDGYVVKLYIEFDDYVNYDKLTGGHACLERKLHDVVKDMHCLCFGFSLIRLKNTEDIFCLLDEMIEKKCYPYYRFYDGYLDNKV